MIASVLSEIALIQIVSSFVSDVVTNHIFDSVGEISDVHLAASVGKFG